MANQPSYQHRHTAASNGKPQVSTGAPSYGRAVYGCAARDLNGGYLRDSGRRMVHRPPFCTRRERMTSQNRLGE
jgi:hypothetical protein